MIALLLAAAAGLAPGPAAAAGTTAEIARALDAGRLGQAKLMIAQAVGKGARGPAIDRQIADLSFASADYDSALGQYQALYDAGSRDEQLCERGAIAALDLGRIRAALPLADCATAGRGATWRAWNARGVIADLMEDWETALGCYDKAHQLAPERAEVVNNLGWSLLSRGDWVGALPYFERAAKLDPKSSRIANNLELARDALAADLPARHAGEGAGDWAARLNDAGVAAKLLGDKQRALAAFTQALHAKGNYYARAANNLELTAKP